jgi:hypothetical protein
MLNNKIPVPTQQMFKRSVSLIKYPPNTDWQYVVWEAGFNAALRKFNKINKK